MSILPIDSLSAGMVLASDLTGSGGRMLLPKGIELQENHLKTLKAWGVLEVDILIDEEVAAETAEDTPDWDWQFLQQSKEYLQVFFSAGNLEHEGVAELFRFAAEQTAQRLIRTREFPPYPWQDPALQAAPAVANDFWQKQPKQAETLLRGQIELVSLPDVYTQIVEVLNSPRSSASDLAEMVSKDTSLSSRLLKLVNSAFYGFPTRIDSISRAVTLIGTNELTTMALGISVVNAFKDIPDSLMSVEGFWRHSIACGVFARLLASHKVGVSAEQMFVGGLLHDIGRMIMLKQIPQAYAEVIRQARLQQSGLMTMERQLLGYDHTEVGYLLCKEWRFSKALEEMVSCHHLPGRARYSLGSCLINLADMMSKAYYAGQVETGCVMMAPLQGKVWETVGLPPRLVPPLLSKAKAQIDEVVNLFLGSDEQVSDG